MALFQKPSAGSRPGGWYRLAGRPLELFWRTLSRKNGGLRQFRPGAWRAPWSCFGGFGSWILGLGFSNFEAISGCYLTLHACNWLVDIRQVPDEVRVSRRLY